MRNLFIIALATASATTAVAQPVQRDGYIRKDGMYVAPSYSTRPNGTKADNYSTQGNYNPYTGKAGTVDPYKPTEPYGSNYGNSSSKKKSTSPW